jgi:hypothetical protein
MERQFRGVYESALKRRGVTGEQMLQILETRLDNVSFTWASPPRGPRPGNWSATAMFASTAARSTSLRSR